MLVIEQGKEIDYAVITRYIKKHRKGCERLHRLHDYYVGKHPILSRQKERIYANSKLVCNHAKLITDEAVGYFIGSPVTYSDDKQDISSIVEWMEQAGCSRQDMDLSKDSSVFGSSFELVYMSADKSPAPKLAELEPTEAFVVYDDTVAHEPVFGVHYYPIYDSDDNQTGWRVFATTAQKIYRFDTRTDMAVSSALPDLTNPFGQVSIVEYANNEEQMGDFEPVISLIDAYNLLQSDRVNDKQQQVEAILVLTGATMGETNSERSDALVALRKNGFLELDDGADAKYVTHNLDETQAEVLRSSIEQDIHKFSQVPCMSDEAFAGNASGVAMRYKLLGFEQLVKVKERYFTDGLRRRLRLFCSIASVKGMPSIDPESIQITFSRNLPSNEMELAQVVQTLSGIVPDEILLRLLPFVDDPEKAVKQVQEQKEAAALQQQSIFAASGVNEDGTGDSKQ